MTTARSSSATACASWTAYALGAAGVARDAGVGDEEVGEPYQRVAAYAVVTSARGVLLTQFNAQTHVPGDWGLPGGGLDDGESPVDGVHREVWEETGQRIELGALLTVQSQHWVGRAPSGMLEDFHAVRIVYAATCPEPAETSSSTTSAARRPTRAGCRSTELGDYRLTPRRGGRSRCACSTGSQPERAARAATYDAP